MKPLSPTGEKGATSKLFFLTQIIFIFIFCAVGSGCSLSEQNALLSSVKLSDTSLLKTVLRTKGVNVNQSDFRGWTPLHWAVQMTHMEVAEILLKHGANPNSQNKAGASPLHLSAFYSSGPSMTKLLLENGAKPNVKMLDGNTVLHVAISSRQVGYLDKTMVLLKHSANPRIKNNEGKTAFDLARNDKNLLKLIQLNSQYHKKLNSTNP